MRGDDAPAVCTCRRFAAKFVFLQQTATLILPVASSWVDVMISQEDRSMARGTWASGCAFLLYAAALQAQGVAGGDGCAVLEELVEASVHAAATEHPLQGVTLRQARAGRALDRSGAVASLAAEGEVCGATVEVATRAFSRALATLNLPVVWNYPQPNPGVHCWHVDLMKCFPHMDPSQPPLPPGQAAFVYDAWKGVRSALASQMPLGTAGGVSMFTEVSLDAALSSQLEAALDGPLYSSYVVSDGSARR
jgi:hypothetical protein